MMVTAPGSRCEGRFKAVDDQDDIIQLRTGKQELPSEQGNSRMPGYEASGARQGSVEPVDADGVFSED